MSIMDRLQKAASLIKSEDFVFLRYDDEIVATLADAHAEIERLREALKFYADPKTYYDVGHIVGWDYGSIARSALQQKDTE